MKTVFRYFNTIINLKWIQIFFRLYYLFKLNRIFGFVNHRTSTYLIGNLPTLVPFNFWRKSNLFVSNVFSFQNCDFNLSDSSIWNRRDDPLLATFNLNYLDFITSANAEVDIGKSIGIICQWIKENPPDSPISWHPYPTSLRIVNIIKLLSRLNDSQRTQYAEKIKVIDSSLLAQSTHLSHNIEYHLLGNHLLANIKALIFVSLYFGSNDKNLSKSILIFNQQIKQQILEDGGHFERSPSYHSLVLEDILDIYNILPQKYQILGDEIKTNSAKMLKWLQFLLHRDGEIALFNDSTLEAIPKFSYLQRFAAQLGITMPPEPLQFAQFFAQSGFAILENRAAKLLADVGSIAPSYLPAHAHAESLSFEFSLFDRRLLVNSGIGEYGNSAKRLEQRGTAAHNCLRLNGENSSDIWGGFRCGKRARVKARLESVQSQIIASHDGYRRRNWLFQASGVTHQRSWQLFPDKLVIHDRLIQRQSKKSQMPESQIRVSQLVELFFHIHPLWQVLRMPQISKQHSSEFILVNGGRQVNFSGSKSFNWTIEASHYHPRFGGAIANYRLVGRSLSPLPLDAITEISW